MPTLKDKRDNLEQLKARAGAILSQYKGNLPADKSGEVDTLIGQANELKAEIERDLKVAEQTRDIETLTNWIETPKYQVQHGIGDGDGESEDRRAMKSAGWEFHDGGAWKQTSLGTSVAMYPEDVLFGPMPEKDADARKFYTTTRAAMRPEYRKAYEHLIRMTAVIPNGLALSMMPADEQKALSEGLDASGGFLVPPDLQAEVLARTAQMSVMRQLARVQTTSRDVLVWPTVQAASSTAGGVASGGASIFSSGFVGGWVGETPTFTDTDPAFGQFQIPIKKLRVSTRLSNDFVSDSAVNVLAFLAQNGAENLALVEDFGFIAGTGVLDPHGILNGGAATVDVEGSTANTISNTTTQTGTAPKILSLEYSIPPQYVANAVWLMKRDSEGKTRKLTDGQGRFMWQKGMTNNQYGGRIGDLDGYPVYNSDFMPADGTDTNKVYLFGSIQQAYIIAQRAQITTRVLNERYADSDQVGIILWERVGGDTWNVDAIRYGVV